MLEIAHYIFMSVLIAFTCALTYSSLIFKAIVKICNLNFKPFSCETCMTFWTVLIVALIMKDGTLALTSGLTAFLASRIIVKMNTF